MDYMNIPSGPYTADTISLGDDVINFGDYKSQEYRPD